ncbi:MAG: hypothetical protein IJM37_02795 [Lachnospiraceae bacterium]|nr:hypothetical protein [Lachnospiraceae bacterium]
MKKVKNEKTIKIISFILAIVVSVGFTILSYVFCIYLSLFQANSIKNSLYETDYYTHAYEQFCEDVTDILIPIGISSDELDNIAHEADMKTEINKYVEDFYNGTDTDKVRDAVKDALEKYYKKEGIEEDRHTASLTKELQKYISESYTENVRNKWFKYLKRAKNSLRNNILTTYLPITVLTVISITALFLVQKWRHRAYRYLIYASTVAVILTAAGPIALYKSQLYKRLSIQPKYFYDFAMYHIESAIKNMFVVSLMWVFAIFIFAILIKYKKKKLHNLNII